MKEVLWISLTAPYDKVDHAGGQVHNYYLKKLHKSGKAHIKLISFCHPSELSKLDVKEYGIEATIFPQETKGLKHVLWGIAHIETRYNPLNRYAGLTFNFFEIKLRKEVALLRNMGYVPDVIILQWTQMVLFAPWLRRTFPTAKVICIEEDVTYLSYERIMKNKPTWFNKVRYKKMKKTELASLGVANEIICSNKKDLKLLDNENLDTKRTSWCPYYNNMQGIERNNINSDIIFFGAMNREANWKSAVWFIENVFNKLDNRNVRFVVVGSKPPKELLEYRSERIIVTGYVDSIEPYFEHAMCMVVPLQMGAGIKIKVLEGLSSGIPVLANSIGIEGIPADNMKEYIHCESAQDFENGIEFILNNRDRAEAIGRNGKKFASDEFDYNQSTKMFIDLIDNL